MNAFRPLGLGMALLLAWNSSFGTTPEPSLAQRAHAAYVSGDPALAYQLYQFALQVDGQDAQIHNGLGALALQAQAPDLARAHFEHSQALSPGNPVARAGLGLLNHGTEPDSALHGALQQHPDASPLLHTLAYQHARRGRWAEARHSFALLAQRHPERAAYRYNLAVSLDQLGAAAQALPHYRHACTQSPPPAQPPFPLGPCLARIQTLSQSSNPPLPEMRP
ncbi:MAG: tetratricopeptide repeat protein [Zoogloea sp.]|uniref:tetratricopeptide repeat protein n=1 Tax=Zoogloea sp. TaxID=49181 RepID=UPI003F3C65FD